MKTLYTVSDVTKFISAGEKLLLAGDENLLKKLPKGEWIGGTIPYFMSEEGGVLTEEKIYVTKLPDFIQKATIVAHDPKSIHTLAKDYPANGTSYIIIPAATEIHQTFAQNVSSFKNIFSRPLVGWISGVNLKDLGKITPKVFNGKTGEAYENKAILMHTEIPTNLIPKIDIINLFEQGDGDTLMFSETGFNIKDCLVNGEKQNFADYLARKKIDTKLPLVANYCGAMVNCSFQAVNEKEKTVALYAPVFPGVQYKIARPVANYEKDFNTQLKEHDVTPIFSCNCILNYLYANLEGKKTGHITGPITFGEIAYMLLNQTMVYVTYDKKK